jgi:hypothetical protein
VTRIVRLLCLTAIGFLAAAALVRSVLPWPIEFGLQVKWDYFRQHKDEYDAVFLGTSRVFRGVDTPRLHEELAKLGVPLTIFNFGIAGMRAFEEQYVLRHLLELEPQRLRWVFLEGGPWRPDFPFEELTYSSRSVFWHDTSETWTALDAAWRMDVPWGEKLALLATHVDLWLWRLASYGQGRILVDKVFRSEKRREQYRESLEVIASQHGFQSADQHTRHEFMAGREELLANTEPYEQRIAAIDAESAAEPPLETVCLRGVRGERRLAQRHGVRLVYVVQPGYEGAPEHRLLHRLGEIETLVDFNSPSRWPQLFDLQNRYDEKHLNRRGAELFAPLLAAAIAEVVRRAED